MAWTVDVCLSIQVGEHYSRVSLRKRKSRYYPSVVNMFNVPSNRGGRNKRWTDKGTRKAPKRLKHLEPRTNQKQEDGKT